VPLLQAYVLAQLLFEKPKGSSADELLAPDDSTRDEALVSALAEILWQAGQGRRAVVCTAPVLL
jgi:hypothetical protein